MTAFFLDFHYLGTGSYCNQGGFPRRESPLKHLPDTEVKQPVFLGNAVIGKHDGG